MNVKMKINADAVIANIEKSMDLARDARPLLRSFLGRPYDSRRWTLRGSVAFAFASKRDPQFNIPWAMLSQDYMKRKQMRFPGMPTLVRTRRLLDSTQNGAGGDAVVVLLQRKLIYGTSVPYADHHQRGTGRMPSRSFLGMSKEMVKLYTGLIAKYFAQTMNTGQPPEVKP